MRTLFFFLIVVSFVACNSKKNANHVPAVITSTAKIDGEQLFKINCGQCHRPTTDFTAPALAGVEGRWKNKELLYEFIRNSEDVIAKDAYAMNLYKKWNQAYMQPFTQLSKEEVDAILAYCNAQVVK